MPVRERRSLHERASSFIRITIHMKKLDNTHLGVYDNRKGTNEKKGLYKSVRRTWF